MEFLLKKLTNNNHNLSILDSTNKILYNNINNKFTNSINEKQIIKYNKNISNPGKSNNKVKTQVDKIIFKKNMGKNNNTPPNPTLSETDNNILINSLLIKNFNSTINKEENVTIDVSMPGIEDSESSKITNNQSIINNICCDSRQLCDINNDIVCENCGKCVGVVDDYKPNVYNKNNFVSIICGKNNIRNIYVNDSTSYKIVRYHTLLNFLKDKNKINTEKIHENILKQTVEQYIKITQNKILRANNRIECLSFLLFKKCIDFNNPKTQTFIVNYMNLPKGGFSRGLKRLYLLADGFNTDFSYNEHDDLIKLKSYTDKIIIHDDNLLLFPIIIKLYNFTNKLGVFNEFRNDTKICGVIWYLIKLKDLKYNNTFFKRNKIEKNTVKKFYKKVFNSEYNPYFINLINDFN
tara:strand:- start:453 stop:1676 length:1224 start_codon:yes stop_codon:yes gene_type:complete